MFRWNLQFLRGTNPKVVWLPVEPRILSHCRTFGLWIKFLCSNVPGRIRALCSRTLAIIYNLNVAHVRLVHATVNSAALFHALFWERNLANPRGICFPSEMTSIILVCSGSRLQGHSADADTPQEQARAYQWVMQRLQWEIIDRCESRLSSSAATIWAGVRFKWIAYI